MSLANAIATALWRSDLCDEEQARQLRAELDRELGKDSRRLEQLTTHRRQRRGSGRLARMVGRGR